MILFNERIQISMYRLFFSQQAASVIVYIKFIWQIELPIHSPFCSVFYVIIRISKQSARN